MKAMVRTTYGPPEALTCEEVERPVPRADEVLVRLHAVSLNASDWELLTGQPLFTRVFGLLKPRWPILGSDIAGRVEAVGANVTRLAPGDEVFGDVFESWGGFAEYVCAPQAALTFKPAAMTFEQAAALPQAACIALQGLRDKGRIAPGHKVLINGAGGGAGSFAVQLAKAFGAEVTGVDSAEKLDMMRAIGADQVVDYAREDFTRSGRRYDLILDLAAHHSVFAYRRALSRDGVYLMVGGSVPRLFEVLLVGSVITLLGRRRMGILALKPNKDMDEIVARWEAGEIEPVIDRCYPLREVPQALRYLGDGHARGKVVITLGPQEAS